MTKIRKTRDKEVFLKLIDDEIQRIALISQSRQEFEERVTEYKKLECRTIGESDWFYKHCLNVYGFVA